MGTLSHDTVFPRLDAETRRKANRQPHIRWRQLDLPGLSSYKTGKQAIVRFSEFMNAEYDKQGIIAFSIHPGAVKKGMEISIPEIMHGILTDTP